METTTWQRVTAVFILLAPIAVILYDIAAVLIAGKTASITFVVQHIARQYEELPWLAGGLFVWLWLHLFGRIVLERFNNGH